MKMIGRILACLCCAVPFSLLAAEKPNIVFILADDLGFGDVGCNGATRVQTPNIDRIAKEGISFGNAHTTSSTCTPSRYGLLAGEYPWRKNGTGILPGDAALIIDPEKASLPSMLQRAGYRTGVVGKWHLGLGDGRIDWNQRIAPGPKEIGFDYSFLVPATGDRVPCVYLENQQVAGLDPADPITVSYKDPIGDEPTGRNHPELMSIKIMPSHKGHKDSIINGIGRIGYMSGGKAARWNDETMADTLVEKAEAFIKESRQEPFLLYFSTHDIHTPRVPHPRFRGKSPMGVRGDAIVQLDWCVGELLNLLDSLGLGTNTLVVFSSDNGPVVTDAYDDGAAENLGDHKPAGPFSGGKYTIQEGGTRVPLLIRWPGRIAPGTTSAALVCQVDFLASLAALTGTELAPGDAPDSVDLLAEFLGQSRAGRAQLVEHSGILALVEGDWKYVEAGRAGKAWLFNLADDIGETKNLSDKYPERLAAMAATLNKLKEGRNLQGNDRKRRSTPGQKK